MTFNFRSFSHATILAGVFFAVSLIAVPAAHAVKANDLVKINSATIDPPLKAGGSSTLKIAATVIPDWHINSDKPFSEDYIPTKLEIKGPVSVTPGTIKYPPAETLTLDPAAGGDKLAVFGGDIKFEVPLKAAADFAPKPGDELTVTIDYQGCNNNECLRPASVSTTVALTTPNAAAGAIEGIAAGGAKSGGIGGSGDDSGGAISRIFNNHGWFLGFLAVHSHERKKSRFGREISRILPQILPQTPACSAPRLPQVHGENPRFRHLFHRVAQSFTA